MLELQDLKDFSIHNWYNTFKHVTLKAILLEIPREFLLKLQSGECGIDLEEVCSTEYVEQVKNALSLLNKSAFVKNNWHAATDAKMFSLGNLLKVTDLSELTLYISTSDRIIQDLSIEVPFPYYIVLKPWQSIHPAAEFRCIIINNILRGITPRDWPTFYAHYKEQAPQIIESLKEFYEENICNKFHRKHYTFDVIVPLYPEHSISLLDFGSLNSKTNLYAFHWKEIAPLLTKEVHEDIQPVFRYLESDIGIMAKENAIHKFAQSFT